jgi:arylsulfatase A-like enzyme
VVDRFSESVDVMPTICDAIRESVPAQCDGFPLTPFLQGEEPPRWPDAAHRDDDWRSLLVRELPHRWPWDRELERHHLAVLRTGTHADVHFGTGHWSCFDLADPTWRTTVDDPTIVLPLAPGMPIRRSRHADRLLADMVLEDGGVGRLSPAPWEC